MKQGLAECIAETFIHSLQDQQGYSWLHPGHQTQQHYDVQAHWHPLNDACSHCCNTLCSCCHCLCHLPALSGNYVVCKACIVLFVCIAVSVCVGVCMHVFAPGRHACLVDCRQPHLSLLRLALQHGRPSALGLTWGCREPPGSGFRPSGSQQPELLNGMALPALKSLQKHLLHSSWLGHTATAQYLCTLLIGKHSTFVANQTA